MNETFFNPTNNTLMIMLLVTLWSIPWKAIALWKAARRKDTLWFIILMLVNTIGLLEIMYIFIFSRNRSEK